MDPPFGDAFRSHVFSEQTLMSTDLLASSSDPDFMYELVGHLSVCVHASCSLTNTLSSCSNKGVFVQERCRIIRYRLALPREGPSCLASKCNASSVDAHFTAGHQERLDIHVSNGAVLVFTSLCLRLFLTNHLFCKSSSVLLHPSCECKGSKIQVDSWAVYSSIHDFFLHQRRKVVQLTARLRRKFSRDW